MHRRILAAVMVMGLLAVSWVRAEFQVKAESLGPDSEKNIAYGPSSDGRHCVTVEPEVGKVRVYMDGKPGPTYDNISEAKAVMSPDGERWAVYFTDNDYKSFLVLDGERVPNTGWVVPDLMKFSPDSRHFAYVTGGERWNVVLDGAKVKGFGGDVCPVNELVFSPVGGRLAFMVESDGGVTAYVDGEPGPRFDNAFGIEFSPDGKRVVYIGRSKGDKGDVDQVVLDGKKGPKQRVIWAGPAFSSDSKHLAYSGEDSAGHRVFLDGTPGPYYSEVSEVAFSGDGQTLGYLAQERDTWKVFVNREVKHLFGDGSEPSLLQLDQTGDNMAYLLENGGRYLVMHNAKQGQVHDMHVERVVLSPDGTRVAYSVKTNASTIGAYNSWMVVVDGELNKEHNEIISETMQFSPDSKHYAYFARDRNLVVVLDGKIAGMFTSLAKGGPYFHPDGTLEYLGARNGTLYRTTHTPGK
jgi:WD40 repeat protein